MLSAVLRGVLCTCFNNWSLASLDNATRSSLRQQLRARRRALSPQQQQFAANQLSRHARQQGLFRRYRDIAFYLANDGEIDPEKLLIQACKQGRRCYLPVLTNRNTLWFVRYRPGDRLIKNRFGIPEPALRKQRRKPWALGLVLLPLVGFDQQGGRLGMGGGFYDRSFALTKTIPVMAGPRLVGLAHHCQEVPKLPLESWDIPLSEIVTDRGVIRVKP